MPTPEFPEETYNTIYELAKVLDKIRLRMKREDPELYKKLFEKNDIR